MRRPGLSCPAARHGRAIMAGLDFPVAVPGLVARMTRIPGLTPWRRWLAALLLSPLGWIAAAEAQVDTSAYRPASYDAILGEHGLAGKSAAE